MESNKKFKRRSQGEIEQMKALWAESGKNKTQFCREQGINYMTFVSWFKKREKNSGGNFIALEVNDNTVRNDSSIFAVVHLSKGRRVVFHQPVSAEYFRSILR